MTNKLTHLAMILDGNGRWATRRLLPRKIGHLQGIKAIKKLIENVLNTEIKYLTLFIFSTENIFRPNHEVKFIFNELEKFLSSSTIEEANKNNVRLNWIGFKKNLPKKLIKKLSYVTSETKNNKKLTITFAFNYGGQQDIEQAAKKPGNFKNNLLTKNLPPVDLLIRTGNEKRISNFLLYEIAYAEIIFEKKLWPSYTKLTLKKNIREFNRRHRRYGKI